MFLHDFSTNTYH